MQCKSRVKPIPPKDLGGFPHLILTPDFFLGNLPVELREKLGYETTSQALLPVCLVTSEKSFILRPQLLQTLKPE